MKNTLSLSLKADNITGFSYSFTLALLKKLKSLISSNRFLKKEQDATEIGEVVLSYLCDQLQIRPENYRTTNGAGALVSLTEEFLYCFQVFTDEDKEEFLNSKVVDNDNLTAGILKVLTTNNLNTFRDVLTYYSKPDALRITGAGQIFATVIMSVFEENGISIKIPWR